MLTFKLDAYIPRYLYYLQLKSNVLEGKLSCTDEAAVVLASYIAQGIIYSSYMPWKQVIILWDYNI